MEKACETNITKSFGVGNILWRVSGLWNCHETAFRHLKLERKKHQV
jgi:hypothetical protein